MTAQPEERTGRQHQRVAHAGEGLVDRLAGGVDLDGEITAHVQAGSTTGEGMVVARQRDARRHALARDDEEALEAAE